MAVVIHRYDPPERFVAGTVGPPGQRTFFLQARAGSRVTSVALEKEQVAVLAERMGELLDQVAAQTAVDTTTTNEALDSEPLEQPIVEEFRAGTMTLSWDGDDEVVAIEVFPVDENPNETDESTASPEDPPEKEAAAPEVDELLLVRVPADTARGFVSRALAVVSAGRPTCPFCGGPIDAEGHLCPRANGFRRTSQ
jgi:uncharacterized repeat protein (TIGR03847 family)